MDDSLQSNTGKNAKAAYCVHCSTKIILENVGTYVNDVEGIPDESGETKNVQHWWSIPNVFSFENVGFTKNVQQQAAAFAPIQTNASSIQDFDKQTNTTTLPQQANLIKFLTCAVCEKGIIGKQRLSDPKKLYLSVERVKYQ